MTQLSLWKSRNGCPMERGQWRPRARAGGGRPHPWGGCCRCHSEAEPRMALAFRLQVRGEGQRGPAGTAATALWPTPVALQAASSLLRSPGRSAPPRAPVGTCPDPNDGVHGSDRRGPSRQLCARAHGAGLKPPRGRQRPHSQATRPWGACPQRRRCPKSFARSPLPLEVLRALLRGAPRADRGVSDVEMCSGPGASAGLGPGAAAGDQGCGGATARPAAHHLLRVWARVQWVLELRGISPRVGLGRGETLLRSRCSNQGAFTRGRAGPEGGREGARCEAWRGAPAAGSLGMRGARGPVCLPMRLELRRGRSAPTLHPWLQGSGPFL